MTVKKFRVFLASNLEKEEQWLTEMSRKGLHLKKYRFCMYYFDENLNESYIYQTDFRPDAEEEYFQLYRDAGWQHVGNALNLFHYFRTEADQSGIKKLYSDAESIKDSYKRMISFYITLFLLLLVSQIGIIATWNGYVLQYISLSIVSLVILLYLYMFWSFRNRMKFYKK
ncbi:DUF2812 domain-containing protein [Ornithinibacillus sp. L9]|uniref:DUF2812 domain-containing protein n=1 Tax=Ornithinibacillus caprae TaxID=2678566 RepID=A0A6N8FIG0_9BACI|nr:DUF2812 domain-containing protein [Ornithinibacillus caprae]MUK89245.1 DUF2812 domain-containing protein [Ornithinibacillus caprae]